MVIVIGFRRSGNHLLIETIRKNFKFDMFPEAVHPGFDLHTAAILRRCLNVVCIYRNPLDVMNRLGRGEPKFKLASCRRKELNMDKEEFEGCEMATVDMLSKVELENETCGLKHSAEDPAENHKAVDYLCQKVGDPESGVGFYELRIPICEECSEAMHDRDWILVYCVNCLKSQWIFRPRAKKQYPKGNLVYWLDVCPYCAKSADDLYKNKEDPNG